MMTSSNGNIFRVTGPLCGKFTGPGEFPTQRPVTRSFDVFFDLRPNKRLSKQWRGWWFETLSRPFWRHRNVSGVITRDQGKVHAKGEGQRSKVKVTEVTTHLNRFRTVTPVWIHIWWWNDTYSLMLLRRGALLFLAATKQLYEWFSPSVCLSVCLSVRLSVRLSVTPFWLCSHHPIIMKFSGVITSDKSDVHAKGQGQRSKVKVTEVTTQLNRFRTVTPVWIHIWWWDDAYSLIMLRRGALLFLKVIRQISRSHGSKNRRVWPRLGVSGL